jgi:tetratricopeptide (TPR) repeat protein
MSEIEKFLPDVSRYHDGEDFTSLLVLRAKILLACGRAKDAVPEIELALRRHPFNEEVLTVSAHAFLEAGDLERATFILNRAARSGIKDPWIEILRGELGEARTMPQEAMLHYQKATLYPVANQDFEALSYLTAKLQPIAASGAQPVAEQALASCRRLKAALGK